MHECGMKLEDQYSYMYITLIQQLVKDCRSTITASICQQCGCSTGSHS